MAMNNSLAEVHPELVSEWSEKNKIKPTEVSIGSHKKVIWRCEKGHEWEAAVKSRTINKTGCPYCSHNKVLVGFNDLATLLPDIAAEWSEKNLPLKPDEVNVKASYYDCRRRYYILSCLQEMVRCLSYVSDLCRYHGSFAGCHNSAGLV